MGPIGVAQHLVPFLPQQGKKGIKAISAAKYGSASILPISHAYISMMGSEGLMRATAVAVLSANYVAKKLSGAFPLLYTGKNGLIAHEAIIDIRPLQASTGIDNDDIAKRLVDYGFHAPTMSFPVNGTLMIEPTESEPLEELDRFIDAMLAIRAEAQKVQDGHWPAEDNPLVNSPHTASQLTGEWEHPYSRETAVFPVAGQAKSKYWPPVRRLDGAFGDRNLVCSCPPIESFIKN